MVEALAAQAHEDWRNQWRQKNGNTPRIKDVKDQDWIETNGTDKVDIAATAYKDLPSDWQTENKQGAETAVDLVLDAVRRCQDLNTSFIEEAAAKIHTEWVKRNQWCKGTELDKPYEDLPDAEQEKDRIWIRRAIEALN